MNVGLIKVQYKIKGKMHDLWLVVTKRTNGGYCWLLGRSPKESIVGVIKEAFTAYGFRWKIEEYHRHIKECYNLEDIQINTFRRVTKYVSNTYHRHEHHILISFIPAHKAIA